MYYRNFPYAFPKNFTFSKIFTSCSSGHLLLPVHARSISIIFQRKPVDISKYYKVNSQPVGEGS